jgi:hypothetical protein
VTREAGSSRMPLRDALRTAVRVTTGSIAAALLAAGLLVALPGLAAAQPGSGGGPGGAGGSPAGPNLYASPDGSSSNAPCATPSEPCDLQTALDNATSSGDIVDLEPDPGSADVTFDGNFSYAPQDDTAIAIQATSDVSPPMTPVLDGEADGSVLTIGSNATVAVSGIEIVDGYAESGGGIDNEGNLTLEDSTVSDNDGGIGAGIYNDGTLDVESSVVSDNYAELQDPQAACGECNAGGIDNEALATIDDSTVSDNYAESEGGGILDDGNLTVSDSSVLDNEAATGGGLYENGTLTLQSSTIEDNDASVAGGGIDNEADATISDTTISYNCSAGDDGAGGGIYNDTAGDLELEDSTLAHNLDPLEGGGIYNLGFSDVEVSTFYANSASSSEGVGGAIDNDGGELLLESSTLYDNVAGSGQGDALEDIDFGTAVIGASIFATPPASEVTAGDGMLAAAPVDGECFVDTPSGPGSIVDVGYNVDDDGTCQLSGEGSVSDSSAIDYYLGPLSSNGGPTQTVPLLLLPSEPTSEPNPALAAIPAGATFLRGPNICSADKEPVTDQRGVVRPDVCDMGSFELTQATSVTLAGSAPTVTPGGSVTWTATVLPAQDGGTVSFSDSANPLDPANACSAAVVAGVATCTVTYPTPGAYQVTASFSGAAGFLPSATAGSTTEDVVSQVLYASPSGSGAETCTDVADSCTLSTALGAAFDGNTIELVEGGMNNLYTGTFVDAASVTIEPAPGVTDPVLNGGGSGTALTVLAGAATTLVGVTVTEISTGGSGGGGGGVGGGGGGSGGGGPPPPPVIGPRQAAQSAECGGGIENDGDLTVEDSTITGNGAELGGGLCNFPDATMVLDHSTVSQNDAEGGGGILNGGSLLLVGSTVAENEALVADDLGGVGGGLFNEEGTTIVESSTVSDNSAVGTAAGAAVDVSSGTVTLAASIIASPGGPPSSGECAAGKGASIVDAGYDVADDSSCDLTGTGSTSSPAIDAYLGTLGSYGGATATVPLLAAPSAPTSAADPALAVIPGGTGFVLPDGSAACAGTDQRGLARQVPCDMGAFELRRTEVVLQASRPSVAPGAPITYTATVSPAPDGGTVSFSDGTGNPASEGCSSLALVGGVASCTVSYSTPGSYQVTASYAGDTDFASATTATAMTVSVPHLATTVELTGSSAGIEAGGSVTYTATVSPEPDGGTVSFSDGAGNPASVRCAAQVVVDGIATCTVKYPLPGAYDVVATYGGDGRFAASASGTVVVIVSRVGTTTSLSASATTPEPAAPVTLSAKVTPAPDGGTVAFLDEGRPIAGCATAPVSAGVATCKAAFPAGPHDVVAAYGGDVGYSPSTSAPLSIVASVPTIGYWLADAAGDVFGFGNASFHGSPSARHLPAAIVAMAATPDGGGYWLVDRSGGVYAFGDAISYGSISSKELTAPVVGMAVTPDGGGYWLAGSNGDVYAFGDARPFGSMLGKSLSAPVVGIAASPSGGGYWLVGADGGVFTFGNAKYRGSMIGIPLTAPVVGMASTPDGRGYWLVAADGGVFTFGDAKFHGSMGRAVLTSPVVAMAVDPATGGYWLVTGHGSVFGFDAPFQGSLGDLAPSSREVAIVAA